MTAGDFIAKWSKIDLTERSAAQQHFLDLCELVGHPKPAAADPAGDSFTFERGAAKHGGGDGWADVWKKDFFGWEYKGRHKDLGAAYDQLLEYRADLDNPPLLVVCDMDIIRVHTNFNNAPTRTHELTLAMLDQPRSLEILNDVFHAPDKLRPGVTSEAITEKASGHFAEIAESMRQRGLAPQAVAHFLVRVVFCLFAEDVGLLERGLFTRLVTRVGGDPKKFARHVADLFSAMATGGDFLLEPVRHFNGSLFDATPVLELTTDEIAAIGTVAGEDWSAVDVSISGTLFERGLNPAKRSQLGSHYTSRAHIETIVEPVVLAPLRHEWAEVRTKAEPLLASGKKKSRAQAEKLVLTFLERLKTIRVLDPAGGSGNFLFVTLQKLLELEKVVNHFLREHGFTPQFPQVNPLQLHCLEIDPYAHDLAQTVVWIGYIQWLRANGYGFPAEPILKRMSANFHCADALFTNWPEVDFIVGNPPFLGNKRLRSELGDSYTKAIFNAFGDKLPATSDLCCYWFEKAREQIEKGKCQRAGLLGTTGAKQISSRRAFERIQETGRIFFAISDRDWFDAGTAVRICMVGFSGKDAIAKPILDGREVTEISANLSAGLDLTGKKVLRANKGFCFMGSTKVGAFDIEETTALPLLALPNATGKPNSDVLRLFRNGSDIVQADSKRWVIDCGVAMPLGVAAGYEGPFKHLETFVRPFREKNNRTHYREKWWIHAEARPGFRAATARIPRYLGTARVAKHRLFVWLDSAVLPDSKVIAIAFADDCRFGVLQSRFHIIWTDATQALHGGERPTYNPTECFETFPFPFADDLKAPQPPAPTKLKPDSGWEVVMEKRFHTVREEPPPYLFAGTSRGAKAHSSSPGKSQSLVTSAATKAQHRAAIAAAAKELNELRERWLNPPEWTRTEYLEFPASVDGPWSRYVDCGGKSDATPLSPASQSAVAADALPAQSKIGLARYPRLVPKDADSVARLKKRTLTNLYNERPAWLDLAHKKLDATVAAAYGWPADLTDEQILERLLALNLERAVEEAKAPNQNKPRGTRAKREEAET